MSKKTIVPFNSKRFLFGFDMLFLWNKFSIGFPIIRAYFPLHFFSRFGSSCTNFTVDELMPISINSNPYPSVVFFEPIYVCISSISTTSILSELRSSSIFYQMLLSN